MAAQTPKDDLGSRVIGTWHVGVGTGIAGVIPMILFNNFVLGKELFQLFGLIPFAVLWGLVYAAISEIDQIEQYATDPRTALPLGIIYGFVVWWGPQIGKPVGEYVSVNGAIQVVLFGIVVGLVYAYSTEVE